MSLTQLETSPQSESKMDISDTTSLDSAGASSNGNFNDMNEKTQFNFDMLPSSESNHHYSNHVVSHDENDLNGSNQTSLLSNTFIRKNTDLNTLNNECVIKTHEQHVGRTLTHSHPLMLPPRYDSDSELDHCNTQNDLEDEANVTNLNQNQVIRNYPDVIPKKKYVHLELMPSHNDNGCDSVDVPLPFLPSRMPKEKSLRACNVVRAGSPDLISSGSELNISYYQTIVDANLQAVTLTLNINCNQSNNQKNQTFIKNRLEQCVRAEDIASLDSISNHSFDGEDIEHNLASLSPSSSIIDGLDDEDYGEDGMAGVEENYGNDYEDCIVPQVMPHNDDAINEKIFGTIVPVVKTHQDIDIVAPSSTTNINETQKLNDKLPQYSASEERKDSKNWQKISLPDGTIRDIDMRVIEPYKRVLSHGGYLKAGGHNAIVMFCACHLPDRSRTDYNYVMDNLFLYVIKTLNQLVTDDYVLIYLHGGSTRRNTPPFPWLKKYYQLLDRRLRKSLKNFYLVHPTFWIKSLIWMARPFVSNKFWRKLVYVKSLDELSKHIIPLEKAAIPDKVKQFDAKRH